MTKALTKRLSDSPEKVFLMLAAAFGLALIFIVPPLFGNDEVVHFPRAYSVQEGSFRGEHLSGYDYGSRVPLQLKQFNDAYREQVQSQNVDAARLDEIKERYGQERMTAKEREPLAFTSATLSAPWDYAPPAVGIWVARTMNLPLNWYVYLGRLFSLVVYILLAYFAIKYIPIGKRFLLMVALLPTSLLQGLTIGMDGLVNGLSWLIIALTFALLVKKMVITPRLLLFILFISLYLATTKQGYVPLAVLPLILPARLFPFSLRRVWIWRLLFGSALLIASLWYLGATAPIAEVIHHIQRPGLHVNEADQLHYIYQHPLTFLSLIFIQPFTVWAASTYAGLVGVLTNRMVYLPLPVMLLSFIGIFLTAFHREREHVRGRDRLYVLVSSTGIFLSTFILINLALYLSFTRVGYDRVEGLQGRYFLALLPLLGIMLHTAMPRLFIKISDKSMDMIVYPVILLGLVSAIVVL